MHDRRVRPGVRAARPEDHGVEKAEDDGRKRDANHERQDGDRGDGRPAGDHPPAVTKIPNERLHAAPQLFAPRWGRTKPTPGARYHRRAARARRAANGRVVFDEIAANGLGIVFASETRRSHSARRGGTLARSHRLLAGRSRAGKGRPTSDPSPARSSQRGHASDGETHQPLRSPAPLRRRVGRGGAHIALALEPVEPGVERADADIAADPRLDFVPDGHTVGAVAQVRDGQQDRELELPESVPRFIPAEYILRCRTNVK